MNEVDRYNLRRYYFRLLTYWGILLIPCLGFGIIILLYTVLNRRGINKWIDGIDYHIGAKGVKIVIPGMFSMETFVPYSNISSVAIHQGPIMRSVGIKTIYLMNMKYHPVVIGRIIGVVKPELVYEDILNHLQPDAPM